VLELPFRVLYLDGTTSLHLPRLILSDKIKIRYKLTVLKFKRNANTEALNPDNAHLQVIKLSIPRQFVAPG
jgi:hypothetical protein